jgi:UDP-glucose 4-epimerase
MSILVTGGAGFIGSHTAVELLNKGYDVIIVDNLVNSKESVIDSIKEITGKAPKFYNVDLLDKEKVDKIFDENKDIEAVIHFAALKAVGESVEKPILYYENNLQSTLVLVRAMQDHNVKRIVFSSSATVYGDPEKVPITEDMPVGAATNPYGETKVMIERILTDIYNADHEWSVMLLRYFNPIGAHESGLIGESPNGIPNNLMPYINQVALGKLDHLRVFGNDYDTPDGTGVRDYIHVVDLAKGHIKAIERCEKTTGVETYNLGTGIGYSVLDIVKNFEKATGIKIKYEIAPRRAGDIAECYADPTKAEKVLGWKAEKNLEQMCKDSWNFTKKQFNDIIYK